MGKVYQKLMKQLSIFLAMAVVITSMSQTDVVYAAEENEIVAREAAGTDAESVAYASEEVAGESTEIIMETENVPPSNAETGTEQFVSEETGAEEGNTEPTPETQTSETKADETQTTEAETVTGTESEETGTEEENTAPAQETQISETEEDETQTAGTEIETGTETEADNVLDADDPDVDKTTGVTVSDVKVSPGSYEAVFEMILNVNYIAPFRLVYTTDKADSNAIYSGNSEVSEETLKESDYCIGSLSFGASHFISPGKIQHTAQFVGDGHLFTDTTYYYRVAYYKDNTYYFMTGLGQFTTKPAVEETAVRIESLSVEDVGYNKVSVKVIVDNPDNESVDIRLYTAAEGQEFSETKYNSGSRPTDEDGRIVPNTYIFSEYVFGCPSIAKVQVRVPVGADAAIQTMESEVFALKGEDIRNAEIAVETRAGSNSIWADVTVSPWLGEYDANTLRCTLCTRPKSNGEWSKSGSASFESAGTVRIVANDLKADCVYEYYIEIGNYQTTFIEVYGSREKPFTIKTGEFVTYDETSFPDPVFRELIKSYIASYDSSKALTNTNLEKITRINHRGSGSNGYIESLEGIQYLSGLKSVIFNDDKIANADSISALTDLTSASISFCELTSLPDLSKMSALSHASFSYNKIVSSDITADKLPEAFLTKNPTWISETKRHQYLPHNVPAKADIESIHQQLAWSWAVPNTYAQTPQTTAPYSPGRLSDESLKNALNWVNVIRYTAGVSSDVTLDDANNELAQAAALLNCLNGDLSHYPERPQGVSDELYALGYRGASSSNLCLGGDGAAVGAWMNDGDESNIDRVGHRRWVLNPTMKTTGFGAVGAYSAMYVFGKDGDSYISDFVAWPAQNMPLELMKLNWWDDSCPWSVSLGSDYQVEDASNVKVTMKQAGTDKTWIFDEKSSSFSGNYFNINGAGYGSMGSCIIFRPDTSTISYNADSEFQVTITGLKNRFGEDAEICYTVSFFSLGGMGTPTMELNKTTVEMQIGQSDTLVADIQNGGAEDNTITWTSSDPQVVSVDADGNIKALSGGVAVITATAGSGLSASCNVYVYSYSLNKTELYFHLAEGEKSETLFVNNGVNNDRVEALWSSSDESVAIISREGVVTPVSSGTAVISAKIEDTVTLTCAVTVVDNILTSMTISPTNLELETGTDEYGENLSYPVSWQLKIYIEPSNFPINAVRWTSSDETVAVVEEGLVRAVGSGKAVITATAGRGAQLVTASCNVTVYRTMNKDTVRIPEDLAALTNVQTTLKDVAFEGYPGWSWAYPDISLTQFAGRQRKSFLASYSETGSVDYNTPVSVALSTLTSISVNADSAVMRVGNSQTVGIDWLVTGTHVEDAWMSKYIKNVTWSSSDGSVLLVKGGTGFSAELTAVAAGKAVVKAETILNGKKFIAQYKVSVSGTDIETEVGGFSWNEEKQGYVGAVDNETERYLRVTVKNGSKLTAASSNKNVVAAGKAENVGTYYNIPLTAKAAGTAKITVTVNDAAGTSKDIWLYVTDSKPSMGETSVTVNKLKTAGEMLNISPNEGYILSGIEPVAGFSFTKDAEGRWFIKADNSTAKGNYKLALNVTVKDVADSDRSYTYTMPALTVKVVEHKPSFKVMQSAKVNVFYANLGTPHIEVVSSETVEKMELTGCDFGLNECYEIVAAANNKITTASNNKGILKITFAGYAVPVETNFTVGVMRKIPGFTLSSKSVTLFPKSGIDNARLDIKFSGEKLGLGAVTANFYENKYDYTLTKDSENNELHFSLNGVAFAGNETIKEKIVLGSSEWTEAVILPYTIKVSTGKPAIKLQKSTLKINKAPEFASYDTASTEILWKGGAFLDLSTVTISVTPADRNAAAVYYKGIEFRRNSGAISAVLSRPDVAAGSYKFKVNAAVGTVESAVPLTVKVVDVSSAKAVKVAVKGTIDILNRSGTYVTATPSLKSVNGSVVDAALTGRDAHLFKAYCIDGKVYLYAKENTALITKYNYGVKLKLTLENALGVNVYVTTPEIKLKLKQGKPQVAVAPKKGVFYSGAYNHVNMNFVSSLKGANAPVIINVELQNHTDVFEYVSDKATLTLCRTGTAVKGKTYTLQFKITLKDQADNEKPLIVKYRVKVI